MESTKQLLELLAAMGCKARFKPYQEAETRAVLLETRRPAEIVGGRLVGEQIDLYSHTPPIFRAWTAHTKKARAAAARYGLHIRLMDGEYTLFIPAILADELLPKFGAKIKSNRKVSPQATEALRQYMANKRLARFKQA